MAHNYGVDTGNALEKQEHANETANREAEDYRELQVAALEKLDPNLRSKHAVLKGKGSFTSCFDCSSTTSKTSKTLN